MRVGQRQQKCLQWVPVSTIAYYTLLGRYLHLNVSQFSDPSSLHRLARVKELPTPLTPEEVQGILGDTADKEYPIFRTDTASDHVDTLCTGVWCGVCGVVCVWCSVWCVWCGVWCVCGVCV